MALAIAAAVAGTTAAAMYADGKLALSKDLKSIIVEQSTLSSVAKAMQEKRVSTYNLFEDAVKLYPDSECIWSRGGCYTFREAHERSMQYGQWYLSKNVKPGDLVAFYLQNSADFLLAWLGLWSIGAAPAMINFNLAGGALLHCLRVSGAKLLLCDSDVELVGRIDASLDQIQTDLGMERVELNEALLAEIRSIKPERPDDKYRTCVKGNWPMSMFYTSGTTGMPKAASFPVSRGYAAFVPKPRTQPWQHGDRWYNCMPLYHGTGGVMSMLQILGGMTLCVGKKFSASGFWDEMRESRSTWFTYVGETARYLLNTPPSPLDKVHNCRGMWGNGLRPDVWHKFSERFGVTEVFEFFNSTEGVFSLSNWCRGEYLATAVGHHGAIMRYRMKDTYVPVRVDQTTGDIVRHPETGFAYREAYEKGGEIFVAVPNEQAFAGYYNNAEATKKKFARDVFKKGDLFYRSGDSLRRTKDGKWFFMDRLGDTFRWKGENVSTAEVSEVMGRYPGVVEANVYGISLPNHDGRAGCAAVYIQPAERGSFDWAGLMKHNRTHLPRYAVPVFIRLVDEMTPIHNNKQAKGPMREQGADPEKVKDGDQMYWIPPGQDTYQPFQKDHWEDLQIGKSKL